VISFAGKYKTGIIQISNMNISNDISKKKNAFSFTFLAESLEVKYILLERERERERERETYINT
jgi:hypothetical protein